MYVCDAMRYGVMRYVVIVLFYCICVVACHRVVLLHGMLLYAVLWCDVACCIVCCCVMACCVAIWCCVY